jgi:hypothetical protein
MQGLGIRGRSTYHRGYSLSRNRGADRFYVWECIDNLILDCVIQPRHVVRIGLSFPYVMRGLSTTNACEDMNRFVLFFMDNARLFIVLWFPKRLFWLLDRVHDRIVPVS